MVLETQQPEWAQGSMLIIGLEETAFPKAMIAGNPMQSLVMITDKQTASVVSINTFLQGWARQYDGAINRAAIVAIDNEAFNLERLKNRATVPTKVLDAVPHLQEGFTAVAFNNVISRASGNITPVNKNDAMNAAWHFLQHHGKYILFIEPTELASKLFDRVGVQMIEEELPVRFRSRTTFTSDNGKDMTIMVFQTTLKLVVLNSI